CFSIRGQSEYVAGIRACLIVGSRIRPDERPVRPEDEVVWSVELDPLDFVDEYLRLAAGAHALDRGHAHLRRAPGADRAAVLADIKRSVRTEDAGIRRAGDIGELPRRPVLADDGELAAIALDKDDAAVRHDCRSLRPAEVGGDQFGDDQFGVEFNAHFTA